MIKLKIIHLLPMQTRLNAWI